MEAVLPGDMAITTGRRDHGIWDCTFRRNLNLRSFMLEGGGNRKRMKGTTLTREADLRELIIHLACVDLKTI